MYEIEMPDEKPRVPMFAIAIIAVLIVGIIALFVLIGLQKPDSSIQDGSVEFAIATQEFDLSEDIVIGINNVTLHMPRDAIAEAGRISITSRPPDLFSTSGDIKWMRPLVVNIEFHNIGGILISNLILTKPAEICFKVTQEEWANYTLHQNEYEVQTYAEELDLPRWEPLPIKAYPERNELCGETNHLSLFALAIEKPEPLIPGTGADPNPLQGPYIP